MKHDHLDDAIDAVAARMTRVEENDAFATRILAALPDRSPIYWWAPRLAITSVLAIGALFVVLRPFNERSAGVLRTGVVSSAAIEMAAAVPEHRTYVEPTQIVRRTSVEPPSNDRRTSVEPPSNDRRTSDVPDFERSLPALGAVTALAFDSLAPVSLPEDAPLTLAPLAIADLPLMAETISPR